MGIKHRAKSAAIAAGLARSAPMRVVRLPLTRRHRQRGAALIDASGSMVLSGDDVAWILDRLPVAIVAAYCARPASVRDRAWGEVAIVATITGCRIAGGSANLAGDGWLWEVGIPQDIVFAAAADHCLAAAYQWRCPGVNPDTLMRWRAKSRAAFQGRPVEEVLADIEGARAALRAAPLILLNPGSACRRHDPAMPARWLEDDCDPEDPCVLPEIATDMRGQRVPELPEASAREGACFIADGLPDADGRIKVVCQSGTPAQIRAFLEVWAPANGLTDIYGDPARGFAGGYIRRSQ